ncbi:MAG TPA: universal stress protein [Steroidobacteraceae bacterium]|nr:universal stress protein [Steroidobacteraceae bacterium]
MIKSIFVPTSGSASDDAVFATALAVARPLGAHLDFYHVRLSATDAAVRAPHVDFCMGGALPEALDFLEQRNRELASNAAAHFKSFCAKHSIEIHDVPRPSETLSACWLEEGDHAEQRLLAHARHRDLVVLSRPYHVDYMPKMLMEDLLVGCGRPILIAPETPPKTAMGTIVVGWKETPEAARALGAAHPLLAKAKKVILLSIVDVDEEARAAQTLKHLASQLRWDGIAAELLVIANRSKSLTFELAKAAAELHAEMLVVGGFGHSRLRELIFGGVTQSLLEHADLPVFMMR